MALPDKTLRKIKIDNSNTYDIVPESLTDGNGQYQVTVPTLTQDEQVAFKSDISAIGNPMVFKGTATIAKSGETYTVTVATPSITSVKDGYVYKITTAPQDDENFKVGDTLIASKNNPGSNPQANWALIPSGDDAGSILDFEINGVSQVTSGIAGFTAAGTYNASTNPIATMQKVNEVIPNIDVTLEQMITETTFQLTNAQYDLVNNHPVVYFTSADGTSLLFKKTENTTFETLGIIVFDCMIGDFVDGYPIALDYTVSINKSTKVGTFNQNTINGTVANPVSSAETQLNAIKIGSTSYKVDPLPTYTSSNENYVLSVDSTGALTWKAPYNGAASGN